MKKEVYLLLAVIWGLGAWAWIANAMRYAASDTLNGFHIVTVAASIVCCFLNLFLYFQVRKKGK